MIGCGTSATVVFSGLFKCLAQIGDQVANILQPDRQAQQVVGNAEPGPFLDRQPLVGGGGGCSGECKGEAPGNLRATLSAKGAQARGCYERALRQNNMLQGRLKIGLRIGPNGSVCSASVTSNELGDPGVASCVVQMFKSSTFPSPQGGCVDAEVPLKFEPKK